MASTCQSYALALHAAISYCTVTLPVVEDRTSVLFYHTCTNIHPPARIFAAGRGISCKAAYQSWSTTTQEFLIRCFGSSSGNVSTFGNFGSLWIVPDEPREWWDNHWQEALRGRLAHLGSCIEQLEAIVELHQEPPRAQDRPVTSSAVFLVHGHDKGARETVARFMERLGLDVIILDEQPNQGRTIIEKFEDHAGEVGFAVVVMTGDDRGGVRDASSETYQLRARQNVIFELGYFVARLRRGRVCALHEPRVEIPSDYQGVVYVPLDSSGTWKMLLGREMRAVGLPVDLNVVV